MIRAAALAAALLTTPISAQTLNQEFATLVQEHDIAPAALTVLSADGQVYVQAAEGQQITDAAPILSLSKTVTGACVMHMVTTERIALEDTVTDILGWDTQAGNVTLGQLLTHSSGYRPDRTQRDILGRFLKQPARVKAILDRRRTTPLGATEYYYNNENYVVLEAAIAATLGGDPMDWCAENVPAIKAMTSLQVTQDYPAIGLAGGFAATTPDLAVFIQDMTVTQDWPLTPVDDGITYGPGVVMITDSQGTRLIHRGGMCLLTGKGHGAVVSRDIRGWAVAFTYTGCPSRAAEADLQSILTAAIKP